MASVDGSILINTGLNNKNLIANTREFNRALSGLESSVEKFSNVAKKNVASILDSNVAGAIVNAIGQSQNAVNSLADDLQNAASKAKSALESISNTQNAVKRYRELNEELKELHDELKTYRDAGVGPDSNLDVYNNTAERYKEVQQEILALQKSQQHEGKSIFFWDKNGEEELNKQYEAYRQYLDRLKVASDEYVQYKRQSENVASAGQYAPVDAWKELKQEHDSIVRLISSQDEYNKRLERSKQLAKEYPSYMVDGQRKTKEEIEAQIKDLEQEQVQLQAVKQKWDETAQSNASFRKYMTKGAGKNKYTEIVNDIAQVESRVRSLNDLLTSTPSIEQPQIETSDNVAEQYDAILRNINRVADATDRSNRSLAESVGNAERLNETMAGVADNAERAAANGDKMVTHSGVTKAGEQPLVDLPGQAEVQETNRGFDELTNKAQRFRDAIEASGSRTSDAVKELESEIKRAGAEIDKLTDKKAAFEKAGDTGSEQYEALVATLQKLKHEYGQLNAIKEDAMHLPDLSGWNDAVTISGTLKSAFQKLGDAAKNSIYAVEHPVQALDRGLASLAQTAWNVFSGLAKAALNAATSLGRIAVSNALSFLQRLAQVARDAVAQLMRFTGNAIVGGLKRLGSAAKSAATAMFNAAKAALSLHKNTNKSNVSIKSAIRFLIRYGLGLRSTFVLVNKLRKALIDAFGNMAKQVPEVNKVLSDMASSLDLLKNSLATAFQPILSVVGPLLTTLMDNVSEAMNTVGEFFATLTGQGYIYKATKAQIDYAKSLDKTKKKAKEAENQLAGFDHLNILKDKSKDDDEDPTATFEKTPLKVANQFAEQLKQLFNKGDFYGIGKLLADKLNEIIEGLDFKAIGKKIGEWVNHVVDTVNGFFDNFDWSGLGARLADGLMSLIDTVDPYELGRFLTQKFGAMIDLLWGFVTNIDWAKVGEFIGRAIQGAFDNIPWDTLGSLLYKAINGVFLAIYTAAQKFDWPKAGRTLANAFRIMIMGIDINTIYNALREVLIGILDLIIPILKDKATWDKIATDVSTFLNNFFQDDKLWAKARQAVKLAMKRVVDAIKTIVANFQWGENGTKFGENINKIVEDFPDDLGQVLSDLLAGALLFMGNVFGDGEIFNNLAMKLSGWVNDIFANDELWTNLGTTVNKLLAGILTFGQTFLDEFKPDVAAENIKNALKQIDWIGIAKSTWNLIKTAFSQAGSFVDALFSEAESPDMSFEQLEAAMNFNKMSIGARIGAKLRNALIGENGIPWSEIASDLWEAAKTAFTITGDFVGALLGVDTAGMDAEQRIKAIAFEVGNKLAGLPWNEIFATAFQTISDVLKSLIAGLLGNEGGNGQVLLWIVGGLLAVKAGIIPAIAKLIAGLAAAIFSSGPALATAITLALGAMATAGVIKLASVTIELVQAQKDLNDALDNEMDTGLSNYVYLWKTKGADAANEFARQTYQIELTGNDMEQNMQLLGQRIADVQGTTFNNVNTIVDTALGTYKTIVRTQGEEAAKEWALNALDIELTGDSTAENMKQLGETIEQYAGNSKDTTKRIVDEACSGITGSVTTTTTDVESTVSTSTGNIEGTVEGSTDNIINTTDTKGKEIGDNLVSPYSDSLPDIQTLTSQMEAAVNSSTGDMLEDVKTNMNEESRVYSDNMNSISNETSTKWNEAANAQETKLGEMSGDLADSLKGQKDEITTGKNSIEEQTKPIYDKWKASNWLVKTALGTMESNVSTAMTNMANTVKTNMETLETNVKNVMSSLSNANWSYIGEQICNGINQGIHNGWQPLIDACWYLARDMYDAARRALDIRSPSHLFEKGIGLNVGLGIANGITDSEPAIMDSVSDLANLANETMNDAGINGEFKADGTGIVEGLDGVLTTFSDKVQSSFTDMLTKLNAIAETVSFRTPKFAAGTVLPYSVAGNAGSADNSDVSESITASNEELISVIIQTVNNQTTALIRAIEQNSNNSTDRKINTDSIIDEINRRTRAMGKSPLLI